MLRATRSGSDRDTGGDVRLGFLELEEQSEVRFGGVSDVAVDADGRLHLLTRNPGAVVVYDADGGYLQSWGLACFVLPHGITMDGGGRVCVVDQGAHTVSVFTARGDPIGVMGRRGQPSDSGCDWDLPTYKERYLSIRQGAAPFNNPTQAAVAADGSYYVTDGYGNARVHHFSPSFALLDSWGGPGSRPGEFRLPHSVCLLADGRVVVADRENERLQLFSESGEFLEEWTDFQRPAAVVSTRQGMIVVVEAAWKKGDHSFTRGAVDAAESGGFSVVDAHGRRVARYRSSEESSPTGLSPHGLAEGPDGTLYVAEIAGRIAPDTTVGPEGAACRGLITIEPPDRGGWGATTPSAG